MLLPAATLFFLGLGAASPVELLEKRSCPNIHVFGARETTVAQGYGSSITVVDLVLNGHPGSTSEAIVYPACGGRSSCGDISYANSVLQGVAAVASQVNTFNTECPDTELILVGYSQGGQIFDDAFSGGGDTNEGDPRYIYGLPYDVGTCTAEGFAPRPAGFVCLSASKIKSYCDASDPYCCNGDDAATHQGYSAEYGAAAFAFIQSQLSAAGSGTTGTSGTISTKASTTTTTTSTGTTSACQPIYSQCGGLQWTGSTCCVSGTTCTYGNAYYS